MAERKTTGCRVVDDMLGACYAHAKFDAKKDETYFTGMMSQGGITAANKGDVNARIGSYMGHVADMSEYAGYSRFR